MNKENLKILIVDDVDTFIKIFSVFLKKLGFTNLLIAYNGLDAINIAKNSNPDMIIMDTCMPKFFGFEVCRSMRREDYGKNIAIIGMSDIQYQEEWYEAGADRFVSKNEILKEDILLELAKEMAEKYNFK